MKILFHLWARLKRLKWDEINRLIILSGTIFLLSGMLCLLDIGASVLLLTNEGIMWLGPNYLLGAFLWLGAAYGACCVKRHQGFGSVKMAGFWALFLCAVLVGQSWFPVLSLHILFAAKYGVAFLMNFIFWHLAARFIKISMTSLKYIGVCAFELAGILGGSMVSMYVTPQMACAIAVYGLIFVSVFIFIMCRLLAVKREFFVKKTGGVQDVEDTSLVDIILALGFFWMLGRLLVEYVTYVYLVDTMTHGSGKSFTMQTKISWKILRTLT